MIWSETTDPYPDPRKHTLESPLEPWRPLDAQADRIIGYVVPLDDPAYLYICLMSHAVVPVPPGASYFGYETYSSTVQMNIDLRCDKRLAVSSLIIDYHIALSNPNTYRRAELEARI